MNSKALKIAGLLVGIIAARGAPAQAAPVDMRPAIAESTAFLRTEIDRFRNVYCVAMAADAQRRCRAVEIVIVERPSVGAYSQSLSGRDRIYIGAGTALLLDIFAKAEEISEAATGSDQCAMEYIGAFSNRIAMRGDDPGLRSVPAYLTFFEYARQNPKLCPGISEEMAGPVLLQRYNITTGKRMLGIDFTLLHEFGHIMHGDLENPTKALDILQSRELAADLFAVKAATPAGQHLVFGEMINFIGVTEGHSSDFEDYSDHPLGVRRMLYFAKALREEYRQSARLRDDLVKADIYDDVIQRLDSSIVGLGACMARVEAHQRLDRCVW